MPDRQRDAGLEAHLVADGVDDPVDPRAPGPRSAPPPSPGRCRSARPAAAPPARRRPWCAGGRGRPPAARRARRAPAPGRPAPGRAPVTRSTPPSRDFLSRAVRLMARSPIGSPSTRSSRQAGRARSARTADSVSRSPTARGRAGAPTASGPTGCSARAAYQPPWVAASKASNGAQARAGGAVVDGGVHAAPRVQRGDRGVAAQRERRRRRRRGRRTGWSPAPGPRRAARRTCRRRPPQAASKAGCTLATMPEARHPVDRRRGRASPRARAGAGRPGRRPRPSSSATAADGVEHLAHGGVADAVEAGLDAGQRAGAHVVDQLRRSSKRSAPAVVRAGRCRARCSAAVCEPNAPSQNRSPPAPASPSSRTTSSPPRSASSPQ